MNQDRYAQHRCTCSPVSRLVYAWVHAAPSHLARDPRGFSKSRSQSGVFGHIQCMVSFQSVRARLLAVNPAIRINT
jgi:hypothetical protein